MPIYMKIEGIKGSVTGQFKNWIELESCQFAGTRSIHDQGGTGGSVGANEILVTKYQDDASSDLIRLSFASEGRKASIVFAQSGQIPTPYLRVGMEGAIISSFSVSGTGGDASSRPVESLSLNFTKITYTRTSR